MLNSELEIEMKKRDKKQESRNLISSVESKTENCSLKLGLKTANCLLATDNETETEN